MLDPSQDATPERGIGRSTATRRSSLRTAASTGTLTPSISFLSHALNHMSTFITLQNTLDPPSPVTDFEDPNFDLTCPLSPTSFLKGAFMCSHSNSMASSKSDLPSEFSQFGMTVNVTVSFIQASLASAHG